MRPRAVIFDLDGTITHFNIDYVGMRRAALAELDKMNLRTPELTDQSYLYAILQKVRATADAQTYEKLRQRLYNRLEDIEIKAAREVTLYPGVEKMLRELRNRHIKLGLVTNNGRGGTNLTLDRFRIRTFFDAIVTRDDCQEMKPDAAPVIMVLTELNAQVEEAILVGDGVMDMIAARAAGLRSAAVATGPSGLQRLLQTEPDYVLASISDLLELVDLLGSQPGQNASKTNMAP
jgi:HAD superfamily hydrolase (TIGR01509 family)